MKCKSNKHEFVNKVLKWDLKYCECIHCGYYIARDSDFTPKGIKTIIETRRRFEKELQKRRVLVEIAEFKYGEEVNRRNLKGKFKLVYKIHDYGQFDVG